MAGWRQVPLSDAQLQGGLFRIGDTRVPQETPIGAVSADPNALEQRLGVVFQDSYDSLDYVKIALLELQSGRRVSLIHYVRRADAGTEIHVWWSDVDDASARQEIMEALGLSPEDFMWTKPLAKG